MKFQEVKLTKLDKEDVKVIYYSLKYHYQILLQDFHNNMDQLSMLQCLIIKVEKLHLKFYNQNKFSLKLMYHYANVLQKALNINNNVLQDQYQKNRSLKLITQLDKAITNGSSI